MAKPDPALLDPARYPFTCTIEPRFGDLDVNLHINNAAMAGLIEEGRVRFHLGIGYRELLVDRTSLVASLQIDYLGEANYPDAIALHCAIESVGRTSHRVASLVTQNVRPIAFARTTLVTLGRGEPIALPADFRQALAPWMLDA